MRTVLVTGSDTGVGKTHVVGVLARALAESGCVQVVKPVETGRRAGEIGDAARAAAYAGARVEAITLESFPEPIAPASAAAKVGQELSADDLAARVRLLSQSDWRLVEGAGGIASPIDSETRDWCDFAQAIGADSILIVVPDRIGAIGQARMAFAHAQKSGIAAGVWLNQVGPIDAAVHESNLIGLKAAGVPVWSIADLTRVERVVPDALPTPNERVRDNALHLRAQQFLDQRERDGIRRTLRVARFQPEVLNLADNDYLELARDPAVAEAVALAARRSGTSSSASALVTGWTDLHEAMVAKLAAWHGLPTGLIWSSGYAANSAVLGVLPVRGDIVLADRLIHHSMIAGILRSGARLQRYRHLNLDELEELLQKAEGRTVFVVTETVFSMDGDYPDLKRMAALKRRYGFFWVVDEAHAVGWYGPAGAGLIRAAGVEKDVDVLVGTFGKALGSVGAYTLLADSLIRDQLVNAAGEFIYSTALPPTAVAAASAAIDRIRELSSFQLQWHAASRDFRESLRRLGWKALAGDSPIVPVVVGEAGVAISLAERLRRDGILAGAVRPPTVPIGASRLRFSLKRSFSATTAERVCAALGAPPSP